MSNMFLAMDRAAFSVQCNRHLRKYKPIDPVAFKEAFLTAYPNGISYDELKYLPLEVTVELIKLKLVNLSTILEEIEK